MNYSGCVFLLVETFKDHVVSSLCFLLNEPVFVRPCFNHQRVRLLTNFALKCPPEETTKVLWHFSLTFHFEPRP